MGASGRRDAPALECHAPLLNIRWGGYSWAIIELKFGTFTITFVRIDPIWFWGLQESHFVALGLLAIAIVWRCGGSSASERSVYPGSASSRATLAPVEPVVKK